MSTEEEEPEMFPETDEPPRFDWRDFSGTGEEL